MNGLTDLHCHLLPYVDDGAETLEEALELLALQGEQGVSCVVTTPHSRTHMFESDEETIQRQFERLRREAERVPGAPRLLLGREYFCDSAFLESAQRKPLRTLGGSDYLLVEFSASHSFDRVRDCVRTLLNLGFRPVIAHVERYPWAHRDSQAVRRLIALGAWIQVNAGSILGTEGWKQKIFCRKLMQQDAIHLIASDAHHVDERIPNLGDCAAYVERKMGRAYAKKVFLTNPAKLLSE